jgi:hypothetical protein
MRVSRLVSAPNWRYAIGEILLIVVDVSIALAASSWYEGRLERRNEVMVLQQLRQTLSEDLEDINIKIIRLTSAPFEALKVQGYKAISNAVLREKLISFYEDHYAKLEYNLNLDRDFAVEKVQPYYFRNFVMHIADSSDVDGGSQSWVPIDYEKIKAENYIANLCRFRADLLRRFALAQFESTTASIREILDLIDLELANSD